jgi:F0F1-type ATP synthase membrane subunit c/vacuolar-type H+-ATPase subunit K
MTGGGRGTGSDTVSRVRAAVVWIVSLFSGIGVGIIIGNYHHGYAPTPLVFLAVGFMFIALAVPAFLLN